jgi:hypothetical protein
VLRASMRRSGSSSTHEVEHLEASLRHSDEHFEQECQAARAAESRHEHLQREVQRLLGLLNFENQTNSKLQNTLRTEVNEWSVHVRHVEATEQHRSQLQEAAAMQEHRKVRLELGRAMEELRISRARGNDETQSLEEPQEAAPMQEQRELRLELGRAIEELRISRASGKHEKQTLEEIQAELQQERHQACAARDELQVRQRCLEREMEMQQTHLALQEAQRMQQHAEQCGACEQKGEEEAQAQLEDI